MKYTALTLGPIGKTLQKARSTKGIWAASYLFSYLMREIIKKAEITNEEVILPYYEKKDLTENFEVGLFPDKLIIKGEWQSLNYCIDSVVEELAIKVSKDTGREEKDVILFFKEYLSIHVLSVELSENENVIIKINSLLDTAELKQRALKGADNDFLQQFFEETYYNFFVREEFDRYEINKDNKRFPSTIEIANSALKDVDEKQFRYYVNTLVNDNKKPDEADSQQVFIDKIKSDPEFKLTYRNYQKYIAVVQADGDNTGEFIKQLYTEPEKEKLIERFSKHLLQFGKKSVAKIKEYRGTPIYAGGDDLLFFCPLAHSSLSDKEVNLSKTIFTLIDEIDEVFNSLFTDDEVFKEIIKKVEKKPAISYGISVSYYKFPLNEALGEAIKQLFYTAKKTDKKNAVSFAVLKHSGQFFGTTFHKNAASYKEYTKLLREHLPNEELIRGVAHKLEPQKALLCSIGKEDVVEKRNIIFDNFFLNNFDESVHRKKQHKEELIPFLENLKHFVKDVYSENQVKKCLFEDDNDEKENDQNKYNLGKIYAALRFIEFLNNKEDRL